MARCRRSYSSQKKSKARFAALKASKKAPTTSEYARRNNYSSDLSADVVHH